MALFSFFFYPKKLTLPLTIILLFTATPSKSSPFKTTTRLVYDISDKPSVYEVLGGYELPGGLLPKGVIDYDLDLSTGKFTAYMNKSCSFSLEGSYQLSYKPVIRGYISKGKLESLAGVSVKLFWFWVDIVEVKRSGDDLDFSVGIAGAGFPIENFEESPQCGCGLNCNGVEQVIREVSI